MVSVLEQAAADSKAGHCLLFATCCGLGMVAFGSDGSVLILFVAENGLGMHCFLWW